MSDKSLNTDLDAYKLLISCFTINVHIIKTIASHKDEN